MASADPPIYIYTFILESISAPTCPAKSQETLVKWDEDGDTAWWWGSRSTPAYRLRERQKAVLISRFLLLENNHW